MRPLLLLLLFLSGASACAYEAAWTRLLGPGLGATAGSAAALAAAQCLACALGAALLGTRADSEPRPRRLYALLSFGAAAGAWASIPLAGSGRQIYGYYLIELLDRPTAPALFGCGIHALTLLVPGICLGGMLPVAARLWTDAGAPPRHGIGLLGVAYTAGALAAGLATAGWTLGRLGVSPTLDLAIALSLLLACAALGAGRRTPPAPAAPPPAAPDLPPPAAGPAPSAFLLHAAAFLIGGCALADLTLWTRMLTVLVADLAYARAALLAAALAGLALGALAASPLVDRTRARLLACGALLLAAGLATVASLHALAHFTTPPGVVAEAFGAATRRAYLAGLFRDAALLVGPTALCLGAIMPFLLRLAADSAAGRHTCRALGRLAATLLAGAAVAPALTAGLLIPYAGSLQAALLLPAVVALAFSVLLVSAGAERRLVAVLGASAVALGGLAALALPIDVMRPLPVASGVLRDRIGADCDLLTFVPGPACTVTATIDAERRKELLVDSCAVAGTGPERSYAPLLGHLPALLALTQDRALVAGFGSGAVAAALALHPFRTIDVAEPRPEIVQAATVAFQEENLHLTAGRAEGRVRTLATDAAALLDAPGAKYDVIAVDAPLPYLSGGSALYAEEFYAACRLRLASGGWVAARLPIDLLRGEDLRALIATFLRVFPDATLWYFRSAAVLLGGDRPLTIPYADLESRLSGSILQALTRCGVGSPAMLLGGFVCGRERLSAFTGNAEPLAAGLPRLEYYGPGPSTASAHRENLTDLIALRELILPRVYALGRPEVAEFVRARIARAAQAVGLVMQGNADLTEWLTRLNDAEGRYREALRAAPNDPGIRLLLRETAALRRRAGIAAPPRPDEPGPEKPRAPAVPPPAPEEIRHMLEAPDTATREQGLTWVAELRLAGVDVRVAELLDDPEPAVKMRAIVAAGRLGMRDAVP
ncbi:MAG: hypothetical protein HZA54_04665, partial [Planctomycetes bacterium]|nr:hypothetical protein [Planctomycetota bacterium]